MEDKEIHFPLQLEEAVFLERISRFSAGVIWRGEKVLAHVPNSGRLGELLVPGARALVRPGGGAKTACRLMTVMFQGEWALIDSHMTNDILEYAVRAGRIIEDPFDIRREVKYGQSRLDLGCRSPQGFHLVEAKCVTLVRDKTAFFPDAPTVRGKRHLEELIQAQEAGFHSHIVFFVQQTGARFFAANGDTDPDFSRTLLRAADAGVSVQAFNCGVTEKDVFLGETLQWRRK